MEKNEIQLINKFKEISRIKWIKGISKSTNSVGLTFESLLNKTPDSMYFPDYYGIEIKCSQRFSRYPLKLFSLSFDGPELYEMNRLLKKYGKKDLIYKEKLQLQGNLYTDKYTQINNNYFKLKLDKENKKLTVCVYDLNYQLIEEKSYIEFETIKYRLELKLTKLAVVYASKKLINNDIYFRYYLITLYKLKSFEKFIELLEKGYIKVGIIGRVSRSGEDAGRQKNKNLVFSIPKEKIEFLFKKTTEYNSDLSKR